MRLIVLLIFVFLSMAACRSDEDKLIRSIREELETVPGTFAVAFEDINSDRRILINERETFHAASTMKTPVMIEVYRQVAEGKFSLTDSIKVRNKFKSIVDGTAYSLKATDDSEQTLYADTGAMRSLYSLMYDMIISSSNLATNMIIEIVDAEKVTEAMRNLGAKDIQVRRGVEDNKAFRQGLNNTTTAYDLMLILSKLAREDVVSKRASEEMIKILLDQKFNEIIPAELPHDVKVAHKTGSITGVQHDCGIVILPDGRRYVVVLLSKDLKDSDRAIKAMAKVSRLIFDYVHGSDAGD